MRTCNVPECGRKHKALGFCKKHYEAHQRGNNLGVEATYANRIKGTGSISTLGYKVHTVMGNVIYEHRMLAEKILGRPLKTKERVHHINKIRSDNRPENLVICPDDAYHKLLHLRQEAYDCCGNADWRRCKHCREYSALTKLLNVASSKYPQYAHSSCHAGYRKLARERKQHA